MTNLGDIFVVNVSDKVALIDRLGWGTPREASYAQLDRRGQLAGRQTERRYDCSCRPWPQRF